MSNWKIVRHALLLGGCLFALDARAGEVSPEQPGTAVAEHCLKAMGMQNVQSIKEMAKGMSPEVILDKVFSSVAPDYQKALLSKPSDPAKPANSADAMRDPKFFQPALATMAMPFNWIRITADGRVIVPAPAGITGSDPSWVRAAEEQQNKALPPVLPAPQRY